MSRLAAVAAVACVASMTVKAAIIYSGALNVSIPVAAGFAQVNISASSGFQLSAGTTKEGYSFNFVTIGDFVLASASRELENNGSGFVVGPAEHPPYDISPKILPAAFASPGGYFGFETDHRTGPVLYGYGHLALSPDGTTFSFLDYAYDNSGAPITTPGALSAAPEPVAWAMMLVGVGLTGASLRRRRSVGFAAT